MARIVLIDPTGRATTTVEAVLGRSHEVITRGRIHAPGDCDLVIADLRPDELADTATLRSLGSFGPVLLLVDRLQPIPVAVEESSVLSVLRKPFDAFELRVSVSRLLGAARGPAPRPLLPRPEDEDAQWLDFPFVSAPAGAILRRAAKMAAPLWILGEPGCGRRRVAIAVCRSAEPSLRMVTLFPDEQLTTVLAREHSEGPFALFIPEVDSRPVLEQERLALLLSGSVGFRLVATSVHDPAELVISRAFSRNLYQHLIGLAVQLSPLRERPVTIPPLVQAMVRRIGRGLGISEEISFSPEAMARMQTYMWPGNLVELEAVLNRTLLHVAEKDLGIRNITADEILFTPDDGARVRTPNGKSGIVTALPRSPLRSGSSANEAAAASPTAATETVVGEESAAIVDIRRIVAGLAHDLRNPMTTIKTFAGALSSLPSDEDSRRLGDLAGEACDRIDGYLETLQRYSELGEPLFAAVDLDVLVRKVVDGMEPTDLSRVAVTSRAAIPARVDPAQMTFALANIVAAMLAESAPDGRTTIAVDGGNGLIFQARVGEGPLARLRSLLNDGADRSLSWRLLLAGAACERNGFKVDEEIVGDTLSVRCRPARGRGEVETRHEQTHRIDR